MGALIQALFALWILWLLLQLLETVLHLLWVYFPFLAFAFIAFLAYRHGSRWLRAFGIDGRDLAVYQKLRQRHQLKQDALLERLLATPSQDAAFEQICLELEAHRAKAPKPPTWARWLK